MILLLTLVAISYKIYIAKTNERMFGGNQMRDLVRLICTECREENYYTDKNKKLNPERIEMKKYCPRCNKHTIHREKK